ncbi:MAG: HAMP domain-containing protein [Deltaproteobacteria bacterium]|nr:HAMP domain-containing protein [Deltaproteobacteria bacterium]
MSRIGKFEWKIISALLVTAAAPLLFTLLMVERLVEESMAVGLNEQVLSSLRAGVDLYKEAIESRMRIVRLQGKAAAGDPRLVEALASDDLERARALLEDLQASNASISRIRLLVEDSEKLLLTSPLLLPQEEWKSKTDFWEMSDGSKLEVTFVISRDFLEASDALRELVVTLEDVKENFQPWKMGYYRLFLFIYIWILVAAVVLGVLLSRSVTRRVSQLVMATRRAARGDMSVRVTVRGGDEIGSLAEAFNTMMNELHRNRDRIVYLEKISSWQEIARRLAHEIKNPLTPIQLAVQELHRSYQGDDPAFTRKLDDSLEIVEEEVGSLRRMVETFSEFAKMPSVRPSETDLNAFVSDFLKLNPQYSERVCFRPFGKPVPVELDRTLMGRVLSNLIDNGLEASEDGQGVELEVDIGPGWGNLRVIDHGAGLSDEVRQSMFQPYFTTKAQGTGLGLAIVKKIVLQHGGELLVSDGKEDGTVFILRLRSVLASDANGSNARPEGA